ncbi:single-stranded DNA-binding protein [Gilliamella apicola]|uniref:Single-stranded DNA-binding protein n=1 Tax=Gilliamella apicola TaxID=1196095 RepID=A0A556RSK0_9GAMM|nr:single-stranded DNA-binding protein [Gilliamella apicola]TSJ91803.1 single-stranded DNA-binding protein [Gilliamella apicola]
MSINTMTVTGNAGANAELRYTQQGTAIGDFNLPVKQGYGDNQKTSWVKCILWGKVAEGYAPNIKKGDLVVVSGEFYVEEWRKDGATFTRPCLRVSQIQLTKKLDTQAQQQLQAQEEPLEDDIPF